MALAIISSPRFSDHLTPPGHPERVERHDVMLAIAGEFRQQGGEVLQAATDEDLLRVHDADYVALIHETAGRATALDPDTFTSPETCDVACLAAGAVVTGVDHVLRGRIGSRALALVQPPGHHAGQNRAMGFCVFNNVAIAAAYSRSLGLSRVAIVDYDVHHGNGTQSMFYGDPSVLFISSHQFPYYPGTGAAEEIGTGAGTGFTVNLPLAAGATDADYERVYDAVAWPILRAFRPELILVSAGFDAYKDDPLGGMRLEPGCFGRLTATIAAIADDCCEGRVVVVTEGGYHFKGIADSLRAVVGALDDVQSEAPRPSAEDDTERGEAAIAAAKLNLSKYWPL